VRPAFLIPNLDSYSLNNCIHTSIPTGNHPIIAGPVFFQGIFGFILLPFPSYLGETRLWSLPYVFMTVHYNHFYPFPPSSIHIAHPQPSPGIYSQPTTLHIHNAPLSAEQTLDKTFLVHNPAPPPPHLIPLALPPPPPRYPLLRAQLGSFTSVIYVHHPSRLPTPVRPIMSNSKAHLYGFIEHSRGPMSSTG